MATDACNTGSTCGNGSSVVEVPAGEKTWTYMLGCGTRRGRLLGCSNALKFFMRVAKVVKKLATRALSLAPFVGKCCGGTPAEVFFGTELSERRTALSKINVLQGYPLGQELCSAFLQEPAMPNPASGLCPSVSRCSCAWTTSTWRFWIHRYDSDFAVEAVRLLEEELAQGHG